MMTLFDHYITVAVHCSHMPCTETAELLDREIVFAGCDPPSVHLPIGWTSMDGHPICPKHRIEIDELPIPKVCRKRFDFSPGKAYPTICPDCGLPSISHEWLR